MTTYEIEYIDTFGVRRATLESPYGYGISYAIATKRLKRSAKKAVGISGVKGEWTNYDDSFEFRPRRLLTVLFINAKY